MTPTFSLSFLLGPPLFPIYETYDSTKNRNCNRNNYSYSDVDLVCLGNAGSSTSICAKIRWG